MLLRQSLIRVVRSFPMLAVAATLGGCAAHYASREMGLAGALDPLVAVFRADRDDAWTQFRLGGGLNVVVVNSGLPREFAWRVPTGGISSSPTVMGTTVLVSANDDHLYAIDAASGSVRWRYRAENEIMSQPAYDGRLIYVGIGNANTVMYYPPHMSLVGTGMNKVEAIDATDGIESWWGGLDGSGMPSAAIVGNEIISADGDGTVLALDARSGAYRWDVELPTTFSMSSVVDGGDGRLFVTGRFSNAAFALRASDGSLLWRYDFDRRAGAVGDDPLASTAADLVGVYLQPTAPGPYGMAVTYLSRARQHVYALDKRTGRLLWDTAPRGVSGAVPAYNQAAIALIYGNRIYVGSAVSPIVTALDMRGHVLWQSRVRGSVKGGIAAYDGVLYFGDRAGFLWALDARTGRPIGSIATDMQFNTGSPIIVNASLVDGGTQDVIAVPLSDIRNSRQVAGVTRLTVWERIGRILSSLIPQRDPHREAGYYETRRAAPPQNSDAP